MILTIPANSGLTTQQIQEAQRIVDQFNEQAINNNVILDGESNPQSSITSPK